MSESLKGRHAVISGGGSGIGAAVADALAAAGARVTLLGRTAGRLQEKAASLPQGQWLAVDVTDAAGVAAAMATAVERSGPVAILVNNAGLAPPKHFIDTDLATWNQTLQVNMTGAFLCTQAVLPGMIAAGWGRVINIASTAGLTAYRGAAAYVAAKHGLIGLTRALALECATTGVTVNAVCPGYTDTDMAASAVDAIRAKKGISDAEARAILAAKNPQRRLITPQEVAGTVAWLCQADSGAMTGQSVAVCGGEVMN
jgi:NAD(P)-dependent dehydrogenase (short-subunit alcohol dehydrogenase family)